VDRFAKLLADALVVKKKRVKTRVSRAAKERRLESKRQNSQKKKDRRWRPGD
jgi:ribosome-associated protein